MLAKMKALSAGAAILPALLLTGCELPLALAPRGPAAREIADIWWILFWIASAVSVTVFILLTVALVRARRSERPQWSETNSSAFVLVGGAAVPAVILVGVTFLTFAGLSLFDDPPANVEYTINVTAHTFWWEAEYEGEGFTTANELHIPVGQPVRLHLESADVIHSFWVPQLAGKIEMIPGWTNVIYLEADEPGVYLGKCAEFCGVQHANMEFLVVAQPDEEFQAWRELQQRAATEPDGDLATAGREVFLAAPCSRCHTIRGVNRIATDVGPDLTHVASRRTLAARTLENDEGALTAWVADPQGIKPGNHMPEVNLSSADLRALITYLGGLQ